MSVESNQSIPYKKILNYCIKLTKSVEDGRDLCQETFTRYLEKNYYGDTILFRIAHNLFINQVKHNKVLTFVPLNSFSGPVTCDPNLYDRELLYKNIEALAAEKRQAIKLFADGYSYIEIAEIQGTHVGTIKSRIHTARKRLGV